MMAQMSLVSLGVKIVSVALAVEAAAVSSMLVVMFCFWLLRWGDFLCVVDQFCRCVKLKL
jgi:uncharacterized membrane protein YccF (DUF307 family)